MSSARTARAKGQGDGDTGAGRSDAGAGAPAALSVVLLDRSITYVSVVIIGSGLFLVRYLRGRRATKAAQTEPTSR